MSTTETLTPDVAIVGSGIAGAMVSNVLARHGQSGEVEEIGVLHNGSIEPSLRLLGGDDRADIQIGSDEAGELYVVSGRDGVIRKVTPDPLSAAAR